MSDEHFILEMMPFVIALTFMGLFFLYRVVRLIFLPESRIKRLIKAGKLPEIKNRDRALDELLIRAEKLTQRLHNIEEIMETDRSRRAP